MMKYKKYKNAAEILRSQEEAAADVFQKPQEDISQFLANPDEYLSLDVRQLASAFSAFLQRKSRIEAVRRHDCVRNVVMITSDKCYENVEQIWGYRETDRMGGYDPYSHRA